MGERPKCAECFVTRNSVCHLYYFLKTEIMGGFVVADMKRKGTEKQNGVPMARSV